MTIGHNVRGIRNRIDLLTIRILNLGKEKFECPICGYFGPFVDIAPPTGYRRHARCPSCRALERHRIQFLVVNKVLSTLSTTNLKMLHFAPEEFFQEYFSQKFGQYETADISMSGIDHNVDIQDLPFEDQSYDFVFASHVLEHVPDDKRAIAEIRRILGPNGIAILPVPIVTNSTIEYPEPNPHEAFHVRAPGVDYFERYERYFSRVERFSSESLPAQYQLFIYEDRSQWPTRECPLRLSMQGEKHSDIVPVCYV